jgi:hypothetical protein
MLKERTVTISAYERREVCEAVATRPFDTSAYSTGLYDVLSRKTEILACGLDSEKRKTGCVWR